MQEIIVNSSISPGSVALLGIITFSMTLMYLIVSTGMTSSENRKAMKAKRLIEDGHKRAVNGRKDDGFFKEIRKERNTEHQELPADENILNESGFVETTELKENEDEQV